MMQDSEFIDGLLDFIQASPTPFHVVKKMAEILDDNGFKKLRESDAWGFKSDTALTGKFYVTRNESSIIAFTLGSNPVEHGFRMTGAHTDSPCLKVKPNPEMSKNGYFQLGVEVYGGALLNPWFDRDLSLAGRVNYVTPDGDVGSALVDFERAIATIPSLAIHLDREANENHAINKQLHIPPVLMKLPEVNDNKPDFRDILLQLLLNQEPELEVESVLDYELSFYDTQAPAVTGLHQDFIASARLDNLLSCYTELVALLQASAEQNCLIVCNDHEEVGSMSSAGAQGNFLKSVLGRLSSTPENFARSMDQSMMISVDNAHGIHPNYPDKHDECHGPILNQGPVIKVNANQRYASNGETSAAFRYICEEADVPVQSFVVRSDMACGSTIGPITASEIGVRTIDVGVPTFAMHSIRELAGRWDAFYLYRALREYFQ